MWDDAAGPRVRSRSHVRPSRDGCLLSITPPLHGGFPPFEQRTTTAANRFREPAEVGARAVAMGVRDDVSVSPSTELARRVATDGSMCVLASALRKRAPRCSAPDRPPPTS